jgi:NADH-quinone oxidoreductase subunit G
VGHLKEVVHRFVPRTNTEVNGWWMCDYGRFLAEDLNQRGAERPMSRAASIEEVFPWNEAIAELHKMLVSDEGCRVVASANLSNEALFLVKNVIVDHLGLDVVFPIHEGEARKIKTGHGEWLQRIDAHPNSVGARLMGLNPVDEAGLKAFCADGSGPLLVLDNLAHPWLASDDAAEALSGRRLAVAARTDTPLTNNVDLLLPTASWIETEGTYTSSTGRVQLARRGFPPQAQAMALWEILGRLAVVAGADEDPPVSSKAVLERMAAEIPAFRDITYQRLTTEPGVPVLEEVPDVG